MSTEKMNIKVILDNAASRGLKTLKSDVTKISSTTKSASKSMKGFYTQLAAIGAVIAGGAFLGGSVKVFAAFDDNMRAAAAVTGATTIELNEMTEAAKEMGRTTRYTAANAAEALRFLGMAGFEATEASKALPGVLNLAAAGALDLGQAADIATNVLSAFGLEVEQLSDVNDVLVKTFTSSNVNLIEIGESFKIVGPILKGVGGDFEDLVGSIGLLGTAGIKGTLAGTALKGAIDALLAPTAKEAKLMAQLTERMGGVALKVKDSSGDFIGFTAIIEQLETAGLRGDEALKLFGLRAGPGMQALLNQGSDALKDMVAGLKDAGGVSEEIAAQMEAGIGGQIRKTISVIESFRISIGEAFGPEVIQFLTAFRDTVADLEITIKQMKQNGDFEGWGEALIDVLNGATFAVKKTIQAFNILGNLGNIFLATAAGNFTAATEELLKFQSTVDKFLGIYEEPQTLTLFKIDQNQRAEVAKEAKKVFEAIGKGTSGDGSEVAKAIIPTASLAAQLKAASIQLNAELALQAEQIEQDYDGGIIKLDEYYSKRLAIIKAQAAQEVAILQAKLEGEADISKRVILNAKLYALDQQLLQDTLALEGEKRADQDQLDADKLTSQKKLNDLKLKADKAYQDQVGRLRDEGVSTLDGTFAKELADLQTKQNSEMATVQAFHDQKIQSLRDAKATELEIETAFQAEKQALTDQLNAQQAEQEQLQADQQLRMTEYKLGNITTLASGISEVFNSLYEATGESNKALFYAAKAASVAEATMNIATGVTKALAQGGVYGIATGAIVAAAGAVQIGTILSQGLAEGGEVQGSSPTATADNISIRATAGEFMQPVNAVQHYGKAAMEGIRTMSIPKEALAGYTTGIRSPGVRYGRATFASGGAVSASSGTATSESGESSPSIVNVLDPTAFEQYTASQPGQRSVLNVMGENIFEIKQMLSQ